MTSVACGGEHDFLRNDIHGEAICNCLFGDAHDNLLTVKLLLDVVFGRGWLADHVAEVRLDSTLQSDHFETRGRTGLAHSLIRLEALSFS